MRHHNLELAAALASLICLISTAGAQRINDELRESPDITVCRSGATASRVRQNCDFERTETISLELERTTTIELSVDNTPFCTALIGLEYYQRNAFAHVEGTIDNEQCTASSGSYVVVARIRNADGEVETLEFEEQWQRSDDQPIELEADYPIGEDVDLLRLSSRRTVCRCGE